MTLTSKDLDLSKGHIPKEIMKKGGQKVQSELKKVIKGSFLVVLPLITCSKN